MSQSLTNDDKYVLKGMLYDAITRLNSIHNEMMSIHQLIEDLQKKLDTPQQTVPQQTVPQQQTVQQQAVTQQTVPSHIILPQVLAQSLKGIKSNPQIPQIPQIPQLPKSLNTIKIASESEEDRFYDVDYVNGTCTCEHYKYRGPLECKHIKKARSIKKNK